jgi:SAM-dependent methyltransferase
MNLPDILRRKDRTLEVVSGSAEPIDHKAAAGRHRAILLSPGARLRLQRADEFSAFREFPRDPQWRVLGPEKGRGGGVRIVLTRPGEASGDALGEAPPRPDRQGHPLAFDWPVWASQGPFDLLIEQTGDRETILAVGPQIDPRAKIRPLLKGHGVEVGPGLSPWVRPAPGLEVEYVEEKHPGEWQDVYGKGRVSMDALTPDVLGRYRVGSAVTLAEWGPESLDFIFSNHVFEHLVNPLQVLENWLRRLKPGGVIAGATPDARFTFDLRQPFSHREDFLRQRSDGGFDKTEEMYLRWCRYTAPYNTPEDLRRRNYSIHVHYYTPQVFRALVELLPGAGDCRVSLFLDTAPNNKDFGFIIRKETAFG